VKGPALPYFLDEFVGIGRGGRRQSDFHVFRRFSATVEVEDNAE
jgi:hypothetical protein